MSTNPIIEVTDLKKHFMQTTGFLSKIVGNTEAVFAVDGVDLHVNPGETVAVVGESGCGKTTLGRTILKLYEPTAGTIAYDGTDITNLSRDEMKQYRKDLQVIFQDPLASLNPRKTVRQILKTPLEVHGLGRSKQDRKRRIEDIIEEVGLKTEHLDRYPHQFSGGQQQRIGIARALMLEPKFLVADEPVSALDVSVQAQILNLLDRLKDEYDMSLLIISHDLSTVKQVSDRVYVMYLGKVMESAPTEQLFDNPQHPYTRALLSAVPKISGNTENRILLQGSVPSPLDPPSGCQFNTRCPSVIPGEDWAGTQESFYATFVFKNNVCNEDIKVDSIENKLVLEGRVVTQNAIQNEILEQFFPGDIGLLHDEAREIVSQAATMLAEDNIEEARTHLDNEITSVCETKTPEQYSTGPHSTGYCHRLDRSTDGTLVESPTAPADVTEAQ